MAKGNASTKNTGAAAPAPSASSADIETGAIDAGEEFGDYLNTELGEEPDSLDQDSDADEFDENDAADDEGSDDAEDEADEDEADGDDATDEDDADATDEDEADEDEAEDTEDETEEDSDDAEDDAEGDDQAALKDVPVGLRKRFKKLTGERDAERARADDLTGQVQQLQQQLAARPGEAEAPVTAVDQINDAAQLGSFESRLWGLRQKALRNPDGFEEPDGKGGTREVGPEEVRDLLAYTEQALQQQVPRRREFLGMRSRAHALAQEIYPDLAKPDSQLAKMVLSQEQHYAPLVRAFPEARLLIADALVQRANRLAAQAGGGKPADGAKGDKLPGKPVERKKAKLAPVLGAGGKRGSMRPAKAVKRTQSRRQLLESEGSESDLAASIEADL